MFTAIAIFLRSLPWRFILPALAVLGLVWSVSRHLGNDRDTRDALALYKDGAGKVVLALEHATGENQKWETAPGQIVALGESNRALKSGIAEQNRKIDEQAREAVRLKAKAAELRRIADKAEAQRQSALKRLGDLTITPGTRADCMTLLKEANDALDIAREAGA